MSGFGHFASTAREVEREIAKHGVLLGIDWNDAAPLRVLAREALTCSSAARLALLRSADPRERSKGELFALAELMLDLMRQSAQIGIHTSGGPIWKALGRALYEEAEALGARSAEHG